MKRKVILIWNDVPSLLDTGKHMLEIISVQPFTKSTHFGWILSLRSVEHPEKTLRDWLTVQTSTDRLKWQVERTQRFLECSGLTGDEPDPLEITHKDLIGVVVLAFVEKTISKKTQNYYNRVKAYHANDSMTELDDQF